jgi:hypothetical protein
MGFDATQLTQDKEQILFLIKTNMPIPMLVYGELFPVGKIWSSNTTAKSRFGKQNKAGPHCTFWNSLINFLHTDLDGNLSSSLNPQFFPNWIIICQDCLRDCQKL